MRSIITYYGGKGHSWRRIVPHFPEHHTFVDMFGGAANILLNKEPSKVEVYNDIDSNLVTIFRVLRDDGRLFRGRWYDADLDALRGRLSGGYAVVA